MDSAVGRCTTFLPRLPDGSVYSHVTAAQLWALPLPPSLGRDTRLHITAPRGRRALEAAGVRGYARALERDDRDHVGSLPVMSPARTFRDLAAILSTRDLVAVGDRIIHRRDTLLPPGALIAGVIDAGRFHGAAAARQALTALHPAAESRPESLLRLALVGAGLPELDVNVDIRDGGRFIARPDLRFVGFPVILEYEGRQHADDPRQWRRDIERYGMLDDLGIRTIRATSDDLPAFTRTVARARRALRRAGWTG